MGGRARWWCQQLQRACVRCCEGRGEGINQVARVRAAICMTRTASAKTSVEPLRSTDRRGGRDVTESPCATSHSTGRDAGWSWSVVSTCLARHTSGNNADLSSIAPLPRGHLRQQRRRDGEELGSRCEGGQSLYPHRIGALLGVFSLCSWCDCSFSSRFLFSPAVGDSGRGMRAGRSCKPIFAMAPQRSPAWRRAAQWSALCLAQSVCLAGLAAFAEAHLGGQVGGGKKRARCFGDSGFSGAAVRCGAIPGTSAAGESAVDAEQRMHTIWLVLARRSTLLSCSQLPDGVRDFVHALVFLRLDQHKQRLQ